MKILVVTPATRASRKGNRITADRWARLLRCLGYRVAVVERYLRQPADVLVALHAGRSAASIEAFRRDRPGCPIVVALTGTDIYSELRQKDRVAKSIQVASRLVILQADALRLVPAAARQRTRVIFQSAESISRRAKPLVRAFEFCVAGHLRPVKDPFRAARAARRLPPKSRIRITHLGAALSPSMERQAQQEMQRNPRYRWLGNQPTWRTRQIISRSRALVITSKSEGGPNVICEAVVDDVPVISSRTTGCLGMLGEDYPGYFEVGDTQALAEILQRCEEDARFYDQLRRAASDRKPRFAVSSERQAWSKLLAELKAPIEPKGS